MAGIFPRCQDPFLPENNGVVINKAGIVLPYFFVFVKRTLLLNKITALNYLRSLLLLFIVALLTGCKEPRKVKPSRLHPDFEKAMNLLKIRKDSAFYYFNKVATSPGDSLQIAKAYANMAILLSDAADPFGSQETSLQALKYLNEKKDSDWHTLSSVYNELAFTTITLRNYEVSLDYSNRALKFAKGTYRITALNNKALAYQRLKQYDQALSIYRSILDESKNLPVQYARVVTNIANTNRLQDSTYNAAPELLIALQIRENEKDNWGLSSSYSHLSDYYAGTHPDSALFYSDKMYRIAQQLRSPRDELLALSKLILFSPPELAKKYFIRYSYLNDSLQTSRNNAKNQFALIRYEAAKTKADNLALQKDNTEKKIQILVQRGVLSGTIVFAVLIFFWYRKRKQRMIREQQLKTSQKVHDEVANGIYQIISEIEHTGFLEKEPLLDKLDIIYERSRNISYEHTEMVHTDFQQSVTELLESFASDATRILIVGNAKEIWEQVTPAAQSALKHVLQELMINMKRHSAAGNVVVKFERSADLIKISYSDDGAGLPPGFHYGNGLSSTENRMKAIGGRIIFDRTTTKGLKIQLYIPIV